MSIKAPTLGLLSVRELGWFLLLFGFRHLQR